MPTLPRKLSRSKLVTLTAAALLLVGAYFAAGYSRAFKPTYPPNRLAGLPHTILWAWERPEKLDYLDPQQTGVAFLAKTIYLRGERVISRPRLQPLAVPPGAQVIAVVRIESERAEPPTLSAQQISEAALEVSEASRLPNVVMVQVDFDATTSEREFYRSLLTELRARLPQSTPLSITALASWCKGDNWLDDLPIDEAVPMLFRMGVDRKQFLSQLAAGERFNAKLCQASAGISTDEPVSQLPQVERVYIFSPTSWSPGQVNQVMKESRR